MGESEVRVPSRERHFRFHITTSHAHEALRNCVSRNSVSQHFYLSMNSLQDNLWNSEKPFNRVITCFLLSVIKDGDDLLMSRFATISIHPLQGCYPRRWGLLKLNRSYFLNNMRQFLKTQWPESHQRKLFFFFFELWRYKPWTCTE